jgi:glycosyltransferase involved in cell wall biosynthesis
LFPEASWASAGQLRLARATWSELTKLDVSMVLVPGYYNLPALAAAVWGKLRRRTTVLMTESTEADHARSWWREQLKGILIRSLFDWAIAGGEPHMQYLYQLGFPMNRVARFYDVVDNDFFGATADRLRATSSASQFGLPDKYFLYVGRLSPEKNVDGLIRAYAQYRRQGGAWDLVLAGHGAQRAVLEELARKLNLERHVIFTGMKSTDELPPLYAFASCFVLPSTREPWGLVVNEALASGLPVIVSQRCGCAADLVHNGDNGFLFDPREAGGLEACLLQISSLPEEQQKAMAQCGRAIISRYSPRDWAAEVDRIAASSSKGARS